MRTRLGMTLVEVMMAMVVLAGAALAIAGATASLARAGAASDVRETARDLVARRIEEVRSAPRYEALDSAYAGSVALDGPYTGFTRRTLVSRPAGTAESRDYRTVTVSVSHPRLARGVERTIIVAAF